MAIAEQRTSTAHQDRAKMTKAQFEHAYSVKLYADGSVYDIVHDESFDAFDQWVAFLETNDDE